MISTRNKGSASINLTSVSDASCGKVDLIYINRNMRFMLQEVKK